MEEINEFSQVLLIEGKNLVPIEIAHEVFDSNGMDITKYNVLLFETDSLWIVVFQSSDTPKGLRGSPANQPGFEVKIEKGSKKVLETHYAR